MTAFVVEVVFVRNSHTSEARSLSVNVSDHMAISGARVTKPPRRLGLRQSPWARTKAWRKWRRR
jgi:hypothetical protein